MRPEILERQTVWAGFLKVERLRVRLKDGAEVWREKEWHGDAVAVLPYDPARRTALLVRLFRVTAFDRCGELFLDEACAGIIDASDVDAAAAVRREAHEELGLRLGELELVGRVWPSPGISAEQVSLFLAPYAAGDRTGPGGGVAHEHEGILVVEAALSELAAAADAAAITDSKLLTLVLALRARRPSLFAAPELENLGESA